MHQVRMAHTTMNIKRIHHLQQQSPSNVPSA
jgi:hypothetical protein